MIVAYNTPSFYTPDSVGIDLTSLAIAHGLQRFSRWAKVLEHPPLCGQDATSERPATFLSRTSQKRPERSSLNVDPNLHRTRSKSWPPRSTTGTTLPSGFFHRRKYETGFSAHAQFTSEVGTVGSERSKSSPNSRTPRAAQH